MRLFFLLVFLLPCFTAQAQYHTMFWNTNSLINPASSGVQQKYYAAFASRAQWLGLEGAPIMINAIFDSKINTLHGGAAINYTYESLGLTKEHTINLNYGYHINFQNNRILSFGVSSGITIERIDVSKLIMPLDDLDQLIDPSDDSYTMLNYKFGLFYKSNHFEAGLSSTYARDLGRKPSFYRPDYHWMYSSYRFDIGKNFDIEPNLLFYTHDGSHIFFSSGLLVMYKERIWAGISYASNDVAGLMAGFDIMGMFRLGYSIDYFMPKSFKNNSSHEIILALMLK